MAQTQAMRERIMELLRRSKDMPLDKVAVAKALRLPKERRAGMVSELAAMEEEGLVARIRKDHYVIPEEADLVTGTIQFRYNGNAYVLNERRGGPEIDVSSANTGTSMHGDQVVVRLMHEGLAQERGREEGRLEGRVIRILKRARTTVVGTLQTTRNFFYVIPDDARFPHDVYVQPGKGVLPRPLQVGDKVVVRLDPWEHRHVNPEGEVVELLGAAADPGVDMISIVRKHQLPVEFPPDVAREAEGISETPDPQEVARREDLRGKFILTIDPDDAKDFDDAVDVERTENGWRLGVHIADVSHYVRPGTQLDREARARGNSTYLADRVLPMLPERLSNGICSLRPQVDRFTFSAFIEFDREGRLQNARFARTVIRSAARLTYRQALAILENKPVPPTPNYERGGKVHLSSKPVPLEVTEQMRASVRTAWELASLLRRNRFANGSLDLDFPEVKIWLDDEGRAERLEKMENDISHQLVEEFMLAANEVVARELKRRSVPAVYRVHEDPDPERLADFREMAKAYGLKAGDLSHRREVQKLLAAIRGTTEEYALKLGFLKSLKRAMYAVDPLGHYGLAKADYTHFTSPIRRYADLVVHRVLAGEKGAVAEFDEIAGHLSGTERVSSDAEKDSSLLKKMEYFQRQLSSRKPAPFEAVVVDVRSYGLVVELPDALVSGLIHVSALPDDFYAFDATTLSFVGRRTNRRFRLGDRFSVVVVRVDAYKRQIDFAPAGPVVGREAARGERPARPDQTREQGRGTGRAERERPQRPAGGTQRPVGGTQRPAGGTQRPAGGTQRPAGGTQRPVGGTQRPVGGTQRPAGGTQRPVGGTQRPVGGTQRPVGGTQRPAGGTQRPVGGTQRPVGGAAPRGRSEGGRADSRGGTGNGGQGRREGRRR